jgi:hypothetical protein
MSGSRHLVLHRSWSDANLTYNGCGNRTWRVAFDALVEQRLLAKHFFAIAYERRQPGNSVQK